MSNTDNEVEITKERLAKVILDSGISHREFESLTGISRTTIYGYAHKKIKKIPLSAIKSIAKATQTSAAWIMGWEDDETKHNEVNKKIVKTIESLDDEQKKALLEIARQMIKNK